MKLEGYTIGAFDRGAPRWREALWHVVKFYFFLQPFPGSSRMLAAILRFFGAKIGRGVIIRNRVNISYPWRLSVGDHVWIGEEVVILSLAQVTIESNVCISQRAFLCTGSHDFRSSSFDLITKPITIRQGSWIAAQAFIAPGVTIGPDSMVAAGAVVTRDVAPGTVVSGNPAAASTP
jgi:putative colanic acid biosynthesis acetyltransferase WcaF